MVQPFLRATVALCLQSNFTSNMSSARRVSRSATAPATPTGERVPLRALARSVTGTDSLPSPHVDSAAHFQTKPQTSIPRRPVASTPAPNGITPPPPPSADPPHIATTVSKSRIDRDLPWFILTVCIFVFTTLVLFHADNPNWILVRLSPPAGTLVLSFLSKLTDWTLSGTVEQAWAKIQWGPLLHKSGNFLNFLVVGSGVEAAIKVLMPTGFSWSKMHSSKKLLSPRLWSFAKCVLPSHVS